MIQHFTSDMSELRIFANGNEIPAVLGKDRMPNGEKRYTLPATERELVRTIQNPVLVTDRDLHALISDVRKRYTVAKLYDAAEKITEYASRHGVTTSLSFEQHKYPGLR